MITWHLGSGLKVYVNSKLIKTNRFGRRINPRSTFSSEITLAGGVKRAVQTSQPNNKTFTQMSSMQLFDKQMKDNEVGRTMIYYWDESKI